MVAAAQRSRHTWGCVVGRFFKIAHGRSRTASQTNRTSAKEGVPAGCYLRPRVLERLARGVSLLEFRGNPRRRSVLLGHVEVGNVLDSSSKFNVLVQLGAGLAKFRVEIGNFF